MFDFWYRWLLAASAGFVVVGLLFALFSGSVLLAPLMNPIHVHFWGGDELPPEATRYSRFLFGIIGGLTAGSGALSLQVARQAVARREAWAWRGLAAAVAVWYVVGSAVSAYFGAIVNVLANTGFALALAIPLAGLRRHMGATGAPARRVAA